MAATGLILLLFGFALLIPRDTLAGGMSARNVPIRGHVVVRTPGQSREPEQRRNRRIRIGLGVTMVAAGGLLILLAS